MATKLKINLNSPWRSNIAVTNGTKNILPPKNLKNVVEIAVFPEERGARMKRLEYYPQKCRNLQSLKISLSTIQLSSTRLLKFVGEMSTLKKLTIEDNLRHPKKLILENGLWMLSKICQNIEEINLCLKHAMEFQILPWMSSFRHLKKFSYSREFRQAEFQDYENFSVPLKTEMPNMTEISLSFVVLNNFPKNFFEILKEKMPTLEKVTIIQSFGIFETEKKLVQCLEMLESIKNILTLKDCVLKMTNDQFMISTKFVEIVNQMIPINSSMKIWNAKNLTKSIHKSEGELAEINNLVGNVENQLNHFHQLMDNLAAKNQSWKDQFQEIIQVVLAGEETCNIL